MNNSLRRVSIFAMMLILAINAVGCKKASTKSANSDDVESIVETQTELKTEEESTTVYVDNKVDIVDINSKARPYAVSINNTPVAVKVQTGLNRAYLIYEIPTEGFTCRMLAFFKLPDSSITNEEAEDIVGSGSVSQTDVIIGTVRSARHNFLDICFESNAIFTHFGGSTYAEADEATTGINKINGYYQDSYFWRRNPENLASEHTAYTSLARLKRATEEQGFKKEADSADSTFVFKYNVSDVNLSSRADASDCTKVTIPYSIYQNTAFSYDVNSGNYLRFATGEASLDHETGEQFNAKNIIVQRITHSIMDDDYCWDLKLVGSGDGYYITNGKVVPIKWSKADRYAKTKFTYVDGTEIELSDGRTYVEISDMSNEINIE